MRQRLMERIAQAESIGKALQTALASAFNARRWDRVSALALELQEQAGVITALTPFLDAFPPEPPSPGSSEAPPTAT